MIVARPASASRWRPAGRLKSVLRMQDWHANEKFAPVGGGLEASRVEEFQLATGCDRRQRRRAAQLRPIITHSISGRRQLLFAGSPLRRSACSGSGSGSNNNNRVQCTKMKLLNTIAQ
jgi:hypothetical protein